MLPGSVSTNAHLGAAQHPRDPVGGQVRLDREVDAPGLEDREHRRHPVEVALGGHRDHALPAQPAGDERVPDAVGPRVQLPVGPPPARALGGDRVRVGAHPLLEQLVETEVGQLAARARQAVELERDLLGGEQAVLVGRGVGLGDERCSAVRW